MAFTNEAFCQWSRRSELDQCRHGQGVADTGWGSIEAEAISHLTALKKTMLHDGHSSALRSTIIQKIMANSLFASVTESSYHFYVQTCECGYGKCLVVSPCANDIANQDVPERHHEVMTSLCSSRGDM